jgi:phospholipid/cholesterol/gamma-HCH transport system permease protein
LLRSVERNGRTELVATGAWTAVHAKELDDLIARLDLNSARVIDMREVEAFDTFGARLLQRLTQQREYKGSPLQIQGLAERFTGLFDAVAKACEQPPVIPPHEGWMSSLATVLHRRLTEAGRVSAILLNMLGALGTVLLRVITRPRAFRLTSAIHHLDRVGWQAVPIILLITFLIGAIIAQQGFFHFRKFGADDYVVDMVGILVLREIGVLIVAIMVAGRSGSSYTAELGSMKMREEIDALTTMGLDPLEVLILPRVAALLIALPILAFLGSMSALYGGGLVAWLYGGMSPDIFIARLKDAISITHFKVGMTKAPFMALVIGVVACSEGLLVKGSAESLGIRTTASVVKAIFLVIVLDGLFAIFFASIGM